MSDFIYKNMDYMEGMKEFPDKFFDYEKDKSILSTREII